MPFINRRCLLARGDFGEDSPTKMYPCRMIMNNVDTHDSLCVIVLNITFLGDYYGGK
jgi:hypothetical protein